MKEYIEALENLVATLKAESKVRDQLDEANLRIIAEQADMMEKLVNRVSELETDISYLQNDLREEEELNKADEKALIEAADAAFAKAVFPIQA